MLRDEFGNNDPVPLSRVIELLESTLRQTAIKTMLPMQLGDVPSAFADIEDLAVAVGFRPVTPNEVGIERFVSWYRGFYGPRGLERRPTF